MNKQQYGLLQQDHLHLSSNPPTIKEDFIMYNNMKQKIKERSLNCCSLFCYCLCPSLRKPNQTDNRLVFLQEKEYNITYYSNETINRKYNFFSFLPLVLFNQFKYFGNQFYLLMSISQFVDDFKVGFLFSYIAPLAIVLIGTMIKEAYDDIKRYSQDRKTNNELFIKIYKDPKSNEIKEKKIAAKNIKIGDMIKLNQNDRVPADMVLLKAYNESNDDSTENNIFIRTDQLDGETDWKLRKSAARTQRKSIDDLVNIRYGNITIDPPSQAIYDFKGVLMCFDEDNNVLKESLGLENTLWTSTILASKQAIGVVIYTGKETRAQMNSSDPKVKYGQIDHEINTLNKSLFGLMVFLAFFITALKGNNESILYFLIIFFRFIVLFCGIIPISLRVNLDISKMLFAVKINQDKEIEGTIVRNSTIPEELGRITYVFSDKTGTLTKNEMIFKKLAMESELFTEDTFNDIELIIKDDCEKVDAPLIDVANYQNTVDYKTIGDESFEKVKKKRRNRNKILRDTITAMAICNNVTPIHDIKTNQYTYQASSPDEVALVQFSERLNMKLIQRTDKIIKILNAKGITEEYEILANFPFTSERKRMGIIVKSIFYEHIIFYLKGAETVIENFVPEEAKGIIRENAENLASIGLRTLVLTQKIIPKEKYNKWKEEYDNAITTMSQRKEKVQQAISKLESNMEFLGVTGVEDLLQDNVSITIENMRNAGMKIWMLTGDKVETATCISISAGLKAKGQKLFFIQKDKFNKATFESVEIINQIRNSLNEYSNFEENSYVLVIDGDCLEICLNELEKEFYTASLNAPSVICCRCSPTQKRAIVHNIKKYTDKRTCAIGDGGNDVAMIQEADLGIGIVGKEGLQASLAADFSILQFEKLSLLTLWWGRLAYKNTSTMANFIIHRGLIISLIQFIFSIMFYCNAVALYNGLLMLGYSTIYTCLPAISLLLDRDIDRIKVVKFPMLYKQLLNGRELSSKQFLIWLGKSIFQAGVIMIGSYYLFKEKIFLKIITVTFTELIISEILNVYTEITKFNGLIILSLIATFVSYFSSLFFMKNILDVYYIFDLITFAKIFGISFTGWIMFYIISIFKRRCFPEIHEKLENISQSNYY